MQKSLNLVDLVKSCHPALDEISRDLIDKKVKNRLRYSRERVSQSVEVILLIYPFAASGAGAARAARGGAASGGSARARAGEGQSPAGAGSGALVCRSACLRAESPLHEQAHAGDFGRVFPSQLNRRRRGDVPFHHFATHVH